MQRRYAASIGDYMKLGILGALSPGHRLGVGPQWSSKYIVAGRDQRLACRRANCDFASAGFADLLRSG
jgi:hypothetical protein